MKLQFSCRGLLLVFVIVTGLLVFLYPVAITGKFASIKVLDVEHLDENSVVITVESHLSNDTFLFTEYSDNVRAVKRIFWSPFDIPSWPTDRVDSFQFAIPQKQLVNDRIDLCIDIGSTYAISPEEPLRLFEICDDEESECCWAQLVFGSGYSSFQKVKSLQREENSILIFGEGNAEKVSGAKN